MAKRYFNWKLAIVLLIGFGVLGITAYSLRQWQRGGRADRGLDAGIKAYEQQQWEQAARNLGRYLSVASEDVDALLKYANAHLNIRPLKRNNLQQAIGAYQRAQRVDAKNSEAAMQLARIYLEIEKPGEAELVVRRCIEANNVLDQGSNTATKTVRLPELHRLWAVALAGLRKFGEAEGELVRIVEESPTQIAVYETLGLLKAEYEEYFSRTADYWFDEAVKKNPSSAKAYVIRAGFHLRKEEYLRGRANWEQADEEHSRALADLEKAKSLDLSDTGTRLRLAREYMNAGMLDEADQHLVAVKTAEPTSYVLWLIWAQLALKSQSTDKMAEVAQTGQKLSSNHWDFMPVATELFIQAGRDDDAADCIEQLRQKDINPATTAFLEGLAAVKKGELVGAIRHWRRAMELGNNDPKLRLALAEALTQSGDWQLAMGQLRSLISESSDSHVLSKGHLALAKLLAQRGNWEQAKEHAAKVVQMSQKNSAGVVLYLQARMQSLKTLPLGEKDGEVVRIEKELDKLESIAGDAVEVKFLRFQLRMHQDKFAEAEKLVAEMMQIDPTRIKVAMAEVYLLDAQSKADEAISKLNSVVEQFPQLIEPAAYLARLLALHDQPDRCESTLKDALERIEHPSAQRTLGLLLAQMYNRWEQQEKGYEFLASLAQKLPYDIPIKRMLLTYEQLVTNKQESQKLIDEIRDIEGKDGWQWRYEQARAYFAADDFENLYPQIVPLLKENLLINPEDKATRMLLAKTYQRAGETRLAIVIYSEALNRWHQDVRIIVGLVGALDRENEYDRIDEILKQASTENLSHPDLARLQLKRYLRQRDLPSASYIIEQLLADDPNDRTLCLLFASVKMGQKEYAEAEKVLAELKIQEPDWRPVTTAQIQLNIYMDNPDEALRLCNEILDSNDNASNLILRARTYVAVDQTEKALADFQRAVVIEPNNPQAWTAKSDFHRTMGHTDEAIAAIMQARTVKSNDVDPSDLGIEKRAIVLLLSSDDRDHRSRGEKILDDALISHPQDIQLRLYKARSLLGAATAPAIEEARGILQRITQDQPKVSEAWVMLGELVLRLEPEQPLKAVDIALRGLANKINDRALLMLKARALAKLSPEDAIPTLKLLRELDPNYTDATTLLADTYIAEGNAEQAIDILGQQLANSSNDSDKRAIGIALAVALYKNGDRSGAQERFQLLSQSWPDDPAPLLARAKLLIEDKLWSELTQKVADWRENHHDDTQTPIAIAGALAETKAPQAYTIAEDILRSVIDSKPELTAARNTLAMLLQTLGRPTEAAPLYKQILELEPDNVVVVNNLAWILCEQDKHQQALELANHGLKIAPDYADLIDTRGFIYYKLEQYNKAIEDFTTCVKLYPEGTPSASASHLHLGKALARLGEKDRAIENLKKALQLNLKVGGLSADDVAEAQRLLTTLSQGEGERDVFLTTAKPKR